ncbi:hypothetical protein F4604DRAFT_1679861 [Suillus subluteus]|nr:hypothetical protein F4604DRAFT_1679861 [Suillus subluteus]
MLAEALAKALQVQQTPSPRGTRSRRKIADPPVEHFTDAQHRENKANVRDLFKEAFHLTKDDEYMLHVGASREAISSFMGGLGSGPDPLALQWDMTTTHKSDWNQKVIDLLYSLCWRKARPQVLSDGTHETMQQVGDRLIDHANERLRMARVLSRRTTVTSALLSDRKATGKEDLPVWVYLHSIVETLDKDGMSSDESENEVCEVPVFRLKTMPWRADFSHEMQIIDEQRAGAAVFTPRGSKPAKRLHLAKRGSIRPAVVGLPCAFYNPLWLSDQRPPIKLSDPVLRDGFFFYYYTLYCQLSDPVLRDGFSYSQLGLEREHAYSSNVANSLDILLAFQ